MTDLGQHTGRGPLISRLWSWVLDVCYVAWVLRAPLLSLIIGFLLLCGAPQARDALVDVALAEPIWPTFPVSWRMLALLGCTFFFWAMPVHYAARLLLETDPRYYNAYSARVALGGVTRAWVEFLDAFSPRILGAATFIPFTVGALYAIRDLPNLGLGREDVIASTRLWALAILMLAGVPFLFGYALWRRDIVEGPRGKSVDRVLDSWFGPLFRALGLGAVAGGAGEMRSSGRLMLLFYMLLVGVLLAITPLSLASWFPLALAIPLILGGWVPALSIIGYYGRLIHMPLILLFLLLPGILVYVWGDNHDVRTWEAAPGPAERIALPQALDTWMAQNGCGDDPGQCPRPIIVAAAGGASRAAFFTASVIGHFLDVEQQRPSFTQEHGDRGLKLRKEANDDGRIVRLAGTPDDAPDLKADDVANRIFAISGVSGGAYGAVVTAAALAARGESGKLPCRDGEPVHWYGYRISNSRDCLEALTSGDYLTPVFFGLAFHDQAQAWDPSRRIFKDDRASLLEQAWERRFGALIGGEEDSDASTFRQPFFANTLRAEKWVPLLILNGTSVATGQRIITSDIAPTYELAAPCPDGSPPGECRIFKQAIDYETLIASGISATATAGRAAGDFKPLPVSRKVDIPLSTAATNSARFPVISPPGSIRDAAGNIVDRIVDGGYFENFGVLSALELAKAVVALQPRLAPFVLIIANDPVTTFLERRAGENEVQTVDVQDQPFFSEVTAPLGGVANVRAARGRLAVAELETWARTHYPQKIIPDPILPARFPDAPCSQHVAQIDVWPQVRRSLVERVLDLPLSKEACELLKEPSKAADVRLREVSMSWWLSKPIQINLHKQLESTQDSCNNDYAVAAVWNALQTRSQACYAAQVAGPTQSP